MSSTVRITSISLFHKRSPDHALGKGIGLTFDLEPRPARTLPSGDESTMNRSDVWEFLGSSAVSSRNDLQRIHAAFVARLGAGGENFTT